jgi:dTDP-4-dehydrorhamnose reductase
MKQILVTERTIRLRVKVLSESYSQYEWIFADRTQLSLDKLAVLESQLETIRDFILNCGAYTAVDKAESENELADIVNHKAVKLIAQYAQ